MSSNSRERIEKKLRKLARIIDAIEHTPTRHALGEKLLEFKLMVGGLPMTYIEEDTQRLIS